MYSIFSVHFEKIKFRVDFGDDVCIYVDLEYSRCCNDDSDYAGRLGRT